MIMLLLLVALAGAAYWAGTHHRHTGYLFAGGRPGRRTRRLAGPVRAGASGARPVLVVAGLVLLAVAVLMLWPAVLGAPVLGGMGPLCGPGGIFGWPGELLGP